MVYVQEQVIKSCFGLKNKVCGREKYFLLFYNSFLYREEKGLGYYALLYNFFMYIAPFWRPDFQIRPGSYCLYWSPPANSHQLVVQHYRVTTTISTKNTTTHETEMCFNDVEVGQIYRFTITVVTTCWKTVTRTILYGVNDNEFYAPITLPITGTMPVSTVTTSRIPVSTITTSESTSRIPVTYY